MKNFYSHAPRGARHLVEVQGRLKSEFLLTRPSRGATRSLLPALTFPNISTHTPLAGRDPRKWTLRSAVLRFLLTRPSRGATS